MRGRNTSKNLSQGPVQSDGNEDFPAFERWLRERKLAPEQRVRYFVAWVRRFVGLRATRPSEAWEDTLRVFLEDLGAGRTKGWQLRQAADAITLFCGQFCVPNDTQVSPGSDTEPEQPEPRRLLAEMRQLMELRHYSPRTRRVSRMDKALPEVRDEGGQSRELEVGRCESLSELPGDPSKCRGIDPESSVQRAAFPLPSCAACGTGGHGEHGSREAASDAAGGAVA